MIRFEHVNVYNWHNAIRGMRNPMESWDRMDSYYDMMGALDQTDFEHLAKTGQLPGHRWYMGPNDLDLALRLSRAGSDHGKFMRQILVGVDIIAGAEWWKEFDTYKVGTVANSTSMMHKLGSRFLSVDDFGFDDPADEENLELVEHVNRRILAWHKAAKKKPSAQWRRMVQSVPQCFLYRRTVTMNYENLKNMYKSRRNHRLEEWREFCRWVDSLPYSELITLKPAGGTEHG